MSAVNLLERQPRSRPSARSAKASAGNFCRCTGYQHIVNAIQHAAGQEVIHGRHSRLAEARGPARQAARGPAPHSGPRHLRGRHQDRRHAAPGVQAQRRRARPHPSPSTRAPRKRWTASRRSSPARRSPSSSRRCRSARPSRRRPIAPSPWTSSATRVSRWPWSWPATATSRATPPTPSSSTIDPLPAVVDPELAMTGQPTVIHPDFPNNLAVALVPSGTGVDADRQGGRLRHRQGVCRGRRRHLAADDEPAARAERDGAARRRRALRAGQGLDDDLVVDAEPAHPALDDRRDDRPGPGPGPRDRPGSRRRLRREDQHLRRGVRRGGDLEAARHPGQVGRRTARKRSWPPRTGATSSATWTWPRSATARCSA